MTSYSRTLFGAAIILAALSTQTIAQITFADSGQSLAPFNVRDVALGDINGDGHLDAVTTTGSPAEPNQTWINATGPAPSVSEAPSAGSTLPATGSSSAT